MDEDLSFMTLIRTIAHGDRALASRLLAAQPNLASARITVGATRQGSGGYFLDDISHHV